jgi:hypothetical protein
MTALRLRVIRAPSLEEWKRSHLTMSETVTALPKNMESIIPLGKMPDGSEWAIIALSNDEPVGQVTIESFTDEQLLQEIGRRLDIAADRNDYDPWST